MHQGRSYRKVGDDSFIALVDGVESIDIASAFSVEADGGVVVGPIIGDFAFGFCNLGGECHGSSFRIGAEHLIFRLIHGHVFDLKGSIGAQHSQACAIRGAEDDTADSQVVEAFHASALHLEGEDGAAVTGIVSKSGVECGHSEGVVGEVGVAGDDPVVAFSAFTESCGSFHEGEVLSQSDIHLGTADEVLVVQLDSHGDDIVEIAVVVGSDEHGVHASLLVNSADGDIIVRHDELIRLSGDGEGFFVSFVCDAGDTESRVRRRQHLNGVVVEAFVFGVGGEGAIHRRNNGDVVEAEEE